MHNTKKTDQFYDQVTAMVDQSLASVLGKTSVTNGNVDLESAIASSKKLLEAFRDKTNGDIRELRELAEWDTFTIAFYGETNAGKSTLIESLRILLGEGEKLATQQQFQQLAKDLRVDPHSLATLAESIQKLKLKITDSQEQAERFNQKQQGEEQHQRANLEAIKIGIQLKRQNLSLWQKVVLFFKKLEEEKALTALELQLVQLREMIKVQQEAYVAEALTLSSELNKHLSNQAQVESSFEQLVPLQDGNIIGNGRSDFTLQSNAYCFTANDQKFQLIDVPGIEGDENQVMSAIEASVKKAHAVFYVTRAATPPGSGSEGQEGTINKIKRQLGKQTEVWAIFNKSATNPLVLQSDTLINRNDSEGLAALDKSLTDTLGAEIYKGHISVSGMPAFLASASCLVPNSSHLKSREKFLATMSVMDIHKRSGMNAFLKFIRDEICQNFQKKISDANLNKIDRCLQEGIDHLNQARDNFANAAKKLEVQQKSASSQFDALLSSTSQKLMSECRDQLSKTKTAMRVSMYNYIDSDQSNDDFKERLTSEVEKLKTSVGGDLEMRFSEVFEMFKSEVDAIIKKNQRNIDEILRSTIDDPFSSLKLSFNIDFKMDNGINVTSLISTLGGAAALVWAAVFASNPAGWTIASLLTAAGLAFSFYKGVRSFFSSDYKKEQQRKSTNDNIDSLFRKLTDMLNGNLESASAKISEALLVAKSQMRIPYEQSVDTIAALENTAARMMTMREQLNSKQVLGVPTTKDTETIGGAFASLTT